MIMLYQSLMLKEPQLQYPTVNILFIKAKDMALVVMLIKIVLKEQLSS